MQDRSVDGFCWNCRQEKAEESLTEIISKELSGKLYIRSICKDNRQCENYKETQEIIRTKYEECGYTEGEEAFDYSQYL